MITKDKVIDIFSIIDEFDRNFNVEVGKSLCSPTTAIENDCRNRERRLSKSEIITILMCYSFSTYRNFKEYYLNCIRRWLRHESPDAISYNRFVEFILHVLFKRMLFMKLYAFGICTGITFVNRTIIPIWHHVRWYFNRSFPCLRKNGKSTMG